MVRLQFSRSDECEVPDSLLPDSLWPRMIEPVRVLSLGQIDLFKNDEYSIGLCAKKTLQKQLHKKT